MLKYQIYYSTTSFQYKLLK